MRRPPNAIAVPAVSSRALLIAVASAGLGLVALACDFGSSTSSSTCTITATCEPEGLLLHLVWSDAEPWPGDRVEIHGAVETAWFTLRCESGACALSCTSEPAPASGCVMPLPGHGEADTDGDTLEIRELEVTYLDGVNGPTINVIRHERDAASDERRWPDDLRLEIDGPTGVYDWEFAPPNVTLYAGGSSGSCMNQICDGLIRDVDVSRLEPT